MIPPKVHILPSELDVLRGAPSIARFMGTTPKRIYALHAARQLPLFVEGATICARKTTLISWIERQERNEHP